MRVRLSLRQRAARKLPRLLKAGRQWARVVAAAGRPATRLVFVVGSQRSGTRLPLQVMDYAPEIATYSEGSAPFFRDVLLEPLDRVEALASYSPFPVIALKPICETHRIHELLDRFQASKGIWIFRWYEDAVNSASLKWSSGREALRRLAARDLQGAGWRAGGLSEQKLELVERLYRDDMSLHEANAVMWYLRNGLFFDLDAGARQDILLVRYEDLVADPRRHFARVFDFIELPLPAGFAGAVRQGESSRRPFPQISREIRALCEELHARLVARAVDAAKPIELPAPASDARAGVSA